MTRALGAAILAALTCTACSSSTETGAPVASAAIRVEPSAAATGSPIEVQYTFTVASGVTMPQEPHVVFVHAEDASGQQIWTDDHEPPVPTREWRAGTPVSYSRTMFIPRVAPGGTIVLRAGLYAPRGGKRLHVAGDAPSSADGPAATLEVRPDPEQVFVAFGDGWHNPETGITLGREWRWSRQSGRLAFRNPKRPVELWLELDQPIPTVASPQTVEIRVGGTTVETFTLDDQAIHIHRTPLDGTVLGEAGTVELEIRAGGSFVPANTPALNSTDRRELGVRVFNAYVAPR